MTQGQGGQQQKKGLSPVAWIAIGCAGILVLAGLAMFFGGLFIFNKARDVVQEMQDDPALATARLIAAANPDIELVGTDEDQKTVTFRNEETGEEFTFNYQDIEEGRVTFSSDEQAVTYEVNREASGEGGLTVTSGEGTATLGSVSLEKFPAWLPVYPQTDPQGTFFTESPEATMGAYTSSTQDDLEAVIDYYATELEKAGLSVDQRTIVPSGGLLVAHSPDDTRTVSITSSVENAETKVMVNFTEKK
ncbi:MAG: hypothetical protein ACRD1X_07225 [Vicinamibacteria bacterium]